MSTSYKGNMANKPNSFPDFINRFPPVDLPGPGPELHILKGSSGQVAFFKISKGDEVSLHSHADSWAILVSGEMSVSVGDKTFIAKKGDSWFVPNGVRHGGETLQESLMVEVFCEQRFKVD